NRALFSPAEPDLILEAQPDAAQLVAYVRGDVCVRLGGHGASLIAAVVACSATSGTSSSVGDFWLRVCFAASMSTSAAPLIAGSLSNQVAIAASPSLTSLASRTSNATSFWPLSRHHDSSSLRSVTRAPGASFTAYVPARPRKRPTAMVALPAGTVSCSSLSTPPPSSGGSFVGIRTQRGAASSFLSWTSTSKRSTGGRPGFSPTTVMVTDAFMAAPEPAEPAALDPDDEPVVFGAGWRS